MKAPFGIAAFAALPPRPTASRALADTAMGETKAEEAAEPPVEAMPRIGRSAFLYREPRPGIDGPQYANQCGSCQNYIAEAEMHGAVSGSRCKLMGTFPISDDDSCELHIRWPDGKPKTGATMHLAEASIAGQRPAIDPWQAGYRSDTCVKCGTCRSFDFEHLECEMFESMTEELPLIFLLDKAVKADAKCSLWNPPPPPDEERTESAM